MKKDVIYVDIEDDITAIIEKVKAAQNKIVALVPPKRIGVLQSVVNLKLLQRAAGAADKRVVMITSNPALSSLAAGVAMPVAKNLQTPPKVAEISALNVDDEEVINGEELPVGEHAATADGGKSLINTLDNSDEKTTVATGVAATTQTTAAQAAANAPKKGGSKVPNFDLFRKKFFIFGALGVVLIAFLVWALFFAGSATVEIAARTNPVNINKILTLRPNAELEPGQNLAPLVSEQTKKTQSTEFPATGEKEIGEKASGTVVFNNCESIFPITVESGTTITSNGNNYLTQETVQVPGGTGDFGGCTSPGRSEPVSIKAAEIGEGYNVASGTSFTVSGRDEDFTATSDSAIDGGSKKTVTVISQEDVKKAEEEIKKQDIDAIREELSKQFEDDVVVIKESFDIKVGDPSISPAVGEQTAKGQLAVETTYVLYGVKRDDLKTIFDQYLKTQMSDEASQKIYKSGDESVQFSEFQPIENGYETRVQTTGHIGPQIDEAALKQQIEGKRVGEVQEIVEAIDGVQSVTTRLSPFWVSTVPSPEDTTIKFLVENEL